MQQLLQLPKGEDIYDLDTNDLVLVRNQINNHMQIITNNKDKPYDE
jgi:hypothetical protein